MNIFLNETELLDYSHQSIDNLFKTKKWFELNPEERIKVIYNFVRDEIAFGYNEDDRIAASKILADGYGQCNTKGILFMALLRKAGIPCRLHGFTIDKKLQKGVISGIWYILSPKSIIHSWVELKFNQKWYILEGFIIDKKYLSKIQKSNPGAKSFCGFGIATNDLMNPQIDWNACNTYIQKEGINADLGFFDNPDTFFYCHRQKMGMLRSIIYQKIVRKIMNDRVNKIRTT